uniref:Uncharacterized protein n=1 Tax=Cacopsylla melanoneura TaxID=428564 RepID=A0A8D8YN89_9HEMI
MRRAHSTRIVNTRTTREQVATTPTKTTTLTATVLRTIIRPVSKRCRMVQRPPLDPLRPVPPLPGRHPMCSSFSQAAVRRLVIIILRFRIPNHPMCNRPPC